MAGQKFSEAEVVEILRLAAEDSSVGANSSFDKEGFSKEDIEKVAAEVGIDPQTIGNAIARLKPTPTSKKPSWMEAGFMSQSMNLSISRNYDGVLDDAAFVEVLSEIRKIFGCTGTTEMLGSARTWQGEAGGIGSCLSVSSRDQKTYIKVDFGVTPKFQGLVSSVVYMGLAFPLVFGSLLIFLTFQLHQSPAIPIGLVLVIVFLIVETGSFFRRTYRKGTAKASAKVNLLLDQIDGLIIDRAPID